VGSEAGGGGESAAKAEAMIKTSAASIFHTVHPQDVYDVSQR
jgi:hypothetical protein